MIISANDASRLAIVASAGVGEKDLLLEIMEQILDQANRGCGSVHSVPVTQEAVNSLEALGYQVVVYDSGVMASVYWPTSKETV